MTKKLYVSSTVQKALLTNILIPEMKDGFWQNHRPADHAKQWEDVHIIVTDSEKLGPVDWEIPRLYNFVNPDFIKPNEERLVKCAQDAKSSSNFRSVKKELIELSRIVGGRLTDKNGIPTKANRGTNKPGSTVHDSLFTKSTRPFLIVAECFTTVLPLLGYTRHQMRVVSVVAVALLLQRTKQRHEPSTQCLPCEYLLYSCTGSA